MADPSKSQYEKYKEKLMEQELLHIKDLIKMADQMERWRKIAELYRQHMRHSAHIETVPFLSIQKHLEIAFDALDEIRILTEEANKIQLEEYGG